MVTPSSLVVIDTQYDFLPGGSLAVSDGDAVIPVINELLKGSWNFVAASQDYHPPGHISFASTHSEPVFSTIEVSDPFSVDGSKIKQKMWPDHCIQGTRGAEFETSVAASLKPWIDSKKSIVVQKGIRQDVEAYSGFCSEPGIGPFLSPLATALRENKITTLFIVGLATDYCVRAMALDAKRAGFEVYIIREGVRAVGGETATKEVENEFHTVGIEFITMDDEYLKQFLNKV